MHKLALVALLLGAGSATAAPAKVTLAFGTPTVTGTLAPAAVSKVVKLAKKKLVACYTKHLDTMTDSVGTATATFTIGGDGKVTTSKATGLVGPVETCIAQAIAKLTFARPKDGQPVAVTYELAFERGAFAPPTGGLNDPEVFGGLVGNQVGEINGGYSVGRSGLTPGGGGAGWGTIGTGRYGTIGGGVTGSGYGGMRRRSTAVPNVSIGQPTVTGDLDKAIIRRYVKRNAQKLQYCYERELLATPDLKGGTITVGFTIGTDGRVTTSTASGLTNTNVESCMADVIKAIDFPKPKGDSEVVVSYPLVVSPAVAPAPAPTNATPQAAEPGAGGVGTISHGSGVGVGVGYDGSTARRRGIVVPTAKLGAPTVKGTLDKAILRRYLKRQILRLQYCYEKELLQTRGLEGTVTLAFTIGVEGVVTTSTASGLGNTNVETCTAGVLKAIEFPKPKSGEVTVTYPLTFHPGSYVAPTTSTDAEAPVAPPAKAPPAKTK